MIDPNVQSYFLIILCGFGVVWGYRKTMKITRQISEFEYIAFSTFWGSIFFIPIAIFLERKNLLIGITNYPFIATPFLFIIGLIIGILFAWTMKKLGHSRVLRNIRGSDSKHE